MLCYFLLYGKMIQLYIYIYIYILFHILSIMVYHRIEYISVLRSKTLQFTHPIYNSLHLVTPNSPSILPIHLLLGNHKSVLYGCESVPISLVSSFALYFRVHIQVASYGICLCLACLALNDEFRSILVAVNGIISFFLMDEEYSIVYVYHIFFIHSSVDGHLGWFHTVSIVNSSALNIGMHVSV